MIVWKWLIKKIFYSTLLILITIMVVFFAFTIIPGDAAIINAGIDGDNDLVERLRLDYNLDEGVVARFIDWSSALLQGDLGYSTRYQQAVFPLVLRHARMSFYLTFFAFILTIIQAFLVAAIVILFKKGWIASMMMIMSQFFLAIPPFWIGMLVIQIFSIQLGWFHLFRMEMGLLDFIFPAIVLSLVQSAYLVRYLIYAWKHQMGQSYAISALARGILPVRVKFIHTLRASLTPTIATLGLIWIDLLSGAVIVETLFLFPGLGQLLVVGVTSRDLPLVKAIVLYVALIVILSNSMVSILQYLLNPRLQQEQHWHG